MAGRRWTVVLVPHGAARSRIYEVSMTAIRGVLCAGGIVLLLVMLTGYSTLSRTVNLSRAAALEEENARLAEQLDALASRVGVLSDTLEQLVEHDERIRLLANLEPIDPQVREAGVGGPVDPAAGPTETALAGAAAGVRVDVDGLLRRAGLLASSFREATDSLESYADRLAATPSIMPTQGWLSSSFARSRLHPVLHTSRRHEGIDVMAPMGSPIEAPAAGIVRETGWKAGYGLTVILDHGYGIRTLFAHTSKILVKPGQRLVRGQRLALVGNSGLATGPHLHYEVHVNGRAVDPMKYVVPETITD
jgi:murein DD-endopeptidase MepM/ murein hydrolase activator NlpD